MLRLLRASLAFALLSACSLGVDARRYACTTDASCGSGYHCQAAVCVPGESTGADGGVDGGSGGGPQGTITVNAGVCEALNPTGGTVDGTWYLAGLCTGGERLFPSVEPGCASPSYTQVAGTAQGSLVFSGTTATQTWSFSFSGTYGSPLACAGNVCGELQASLNGQPGASATCTPGASGCTCPFTQSHTETKSWTAAVTGGQLSLEPEFTAAELYDFAVTGNRLVLRARATPRFQYTYVR